MEEIWKPLKDIIACGDNYVISTYGKVKNVTTGHILKQSTSDAGYSFVTLNRGSSIKRVAVHRLVALAFIHNPDNKEQVNHIDGNKLNNLLHNLEWSTPKENIRHAIDTGLTTIRKGSEHGRSVLTEDVVKDIKKDLLTCSSSIKLAEKYNISSSVISSINVGNTWAHVHVEGFKPTKTTREGSNNANSVLNEDDVRQIKILLRGKKHTQIDISKMFNVSKYAISDIARGRTWKHIV